MTTFHAITMADAHGNDISFDQFTGQTCLIVNVASR